MHFNIEDKVPTENFIIENNIVKGVYQVLPESYQLGKLIFDILSSKPDHVSQIQAETEEQTTYGEMKENSVRCALWMKTQGIGTDDVVTICCENHLNAYIPIFATFFVGAAFNAWDCRISLSDAQHLMRTLQPKIIFVTEETAEIIVEVSKKENFNGKIICYGCYPGLESLHELMQLQNCDEVESFEPETVTNPEDIAYLAQSSGSTGLPKGVVHSYGNVVKNLTTFPHRPINGVTLSYSQWAWMTGFVFSMLPIFTYGTKILHREFDPEETCKVIDKYKVENANAMTMFLSRFCKSEDLVKRHQLKSLKIILVGGSKISEHLLKKFRKLLPHVNVFVGMGTTEVGRMIVCQSEKCKASNSLGFVMSNTEIKICDMETKEALGANVPGELCVKTRIGIRGYYKNEEATKAAFDDEGWFHTGDLAYYDENGEFFILERIKDVINYNGCHISPSEIEEILISHPDVVEISVVPIPHDEYVHHAMAFVEKVAGSKVTEEDLVKLSEVRLGKLKKLHGGVKFINKMPRLCSGKIDRQTLKKWAKSEANNA